MSGLYFNGSTNPYRIVQGSNISTGQAFEITRAGLVTLGVASGTQTHVINGNLSVTGNITGTYTAANGSASSPSITFTNDLHSGAFLASTSDWGLAVNSNEIVRLNVTGVDLGYLASQVVRVLPSKLNIGALTASAGVNSIVSGNSTPDQNLTITGNPTLGVGADFNLYGSSHATKAKFVEFTNAGTVSGFINGSNAWSIGASASTQQHIINADSVDFKGSTGIDRFEDVCKESTLADNTSAGTVFSYPTASNVSIVIEYGIKRGTNYETGTILLVTDGTNVRIDPRSTAIGDCGNTFSATVSGSNINLLYTTTSTGTAGKIRYNVRRWNFN